jgi:RNA polymerase sigma factor (sigma-70 family)
MTTPPPGPFGGPSPGTAPDVGRIAEDPDAFEAFYRAHLPLVHRFVARRVADPHLAADLVAEVFLAAIDGAGGYRPDRGSPAGWLTGVARNVVAAEFRRQSRDRDAARRLVGRRLLDADSLTRIEERIDAERETRRLYDALASLPRRDRALMELVAVDGLSVAEAAAVLGVKPGTARVRLHRSRARVQSHLLPMEVSS